MRHQKPYRKLSRQRSHYRALMRNMAFSLFQEERIRTTLVKAKEVRGFVDEILTLAKAGTLHDRRRAMALMGNKSGTADGKKVDVIGHVFKELAPRMAKRAGGYTRIIRLGCRPGDAAPMAYLEFADAKPVKTKAAKAPKTTEKKAAAKAS